MIPDKLLKIYQTRFRICLYGLIRFHIKSINIKNIPIDLINLILSYFHSLCIIKEQSQSQTICDIYK